MTSQLSVEVPSEDAGPRAGSIWGDAGRQLRRSPLFLLAAFFVLIVISWAVAPSLWTDFGKSECSVAINRTPPHWWPGEMPPAAVTEIADEHLLGTTKDGCDMYAEIIWGARPSIVIAVMVTGLTALIGTTLGTIAGFFGGFVDTIISRITDVVLGLPFILGALVFLALLQERSIWTVAFVLVALGWTQMTRIVRGTVISLRDQDFVEAARALGAGNLRIILRHILPNSLAPIIVLSTLYLGLYVSVEATLSFIGVGLDRTTEISWGITIAEGQELAVGGYPHLLVFPCIALVVTVLSFIIMGDKLRDALDPKGL